MDNQVQVSILCLAYNHEKYIRQCLDGFLMQKGVTFEIIIHDDASTDHTADIIREYERKNPKLFKPIYQTENKYTQHLGIGKKYMVPLVTGKYVALCEGDDYWTDPYKLKKQYDALESNPDCYICLHNVDVVNEDGSSANRQLPVFNISTGKMTSHEFFVMFEKTKMFQTSSFFIDGEKYVEYRNNPPKFRMLSPVGDYPTLLYFAYIGNVYYFDEVMSNYRFNSVGSWSSRIYDKDHIMKSFSMRELHISKMKDMLNEFSIFSTGKYDNNLEFEVEEQKKMEKILRDDKYWFYLKEKDYNNLFKEFTITDLRHYGLTTKDIIILKCKQYLRLH